MKTKSTGSLAHIASLSTIGARDPKLVNVPASGLAAAMGVKLLAWAGGRYKEATPVVVTYKKRREVDLDFMYLNQAVAQMCTSTYVPSSREV